MIMMERAPEEVTHIAGHFADNERDGCREELDLSLNVECGNLPATLRKVATWLEAEYAYSRALSRGQEADDG